MMTISKLGETLFVFTLFFITLNLSQDQKRISHNDGKGWDGEYYYHCIEQMTNGNFKITGEPPFVNRYGNHFLIAMYAKVSNQNIFKSALIVNQVGMFITIILLLLWLRKFITKQWIRIILITLYTCTWFTPARLTFFYPIYTDSWGAVFFISGLLILYHTRERYLNQKSLLPHLLLFSVIVSIGTSFRESNAALALAVPFIINPFKELPKLHINYFLQSIKSIIEYAIRTYRANWQLFIPLIILIMSKIALSTLITPNEESSYLYPKALIRWFYTKTFPAFTTAVFIAFGPLLVLLPFYFNQYKKLFKDIEYLSFLMFIALFFGYVGGGDTERILYMSSFPIVYIVLGIAIDNIYQSSKKWWLFVLLFLQTFAMRLYWYIPDYPTNYDSKAIPFFGLIGDRFQYLSLYSNYGNVWINSILLMEYTSLVIITYFILKPSGTQSNISFPK